MIWLWKRKESQNWFQFFLIMKTLERQIISAFLGSRDVQFLLITFPPVLKKEGTLVPCTAKNFFANDFYQVNELWFKLRLALIDSTFLRGRKWYAAIISCLLSLLLLSKSFSKPHLQGFLFSKLLSGMKPGGVGVAIRTPKPQVRGSVLELD